MSDQFKKQVQEYMQIDNDLKQARKAITTLNKRKTSLSLNINGYMQQNDIQELKLNDCKLKTFTSTTTAPLNKDWIYQRLLLICKGDENQAKGMCEFICDPKARDKKQKNSIKRVKLTKKDRQKK